MGVNRSVLLFLFGDCGGWGRRGTYALLINFFGSLLIIYSFHACCLLFINLSCVPLLPTGLLDEDDSLQKKQELLDSDEVRRIAIGVSFGALLLILVSIAVATRVFRRKQYTSVRRWDTMDLDYGKKLFSPAKDEDNELEHDFEIDMGEVNLQTRKLLNNK